MPKSCVQKAGCLYSVLHSVHREMRCYSHSHQAPLGQPSTARVAYWSSLPFTAASCSQNQKVRCALNAPSVKLLCDVLLHYFSFSPLPPPWSHSYARDLHQYYLSIPISLRELRQQTDRHKRLLMEGGRYSPQVSYQEAPLKPS